jgi:uncharacterized protein DUF6584
MGRDRNRPPLLTRIDNEVAAGRLWRAKEIVRGRIGNTWPDSAVIERFGQMLLRMGDDVEAGKYLWLSGVRRGEYEPAIALFLRRHARHGRENLLAQIPKSFRRIPFNELPLGIRNELTECGVRTSDFGPKRTSPKQSAAPTRWRDAVFTTLAIAFFACVIVGFGVGFRTIVGWIGRVLR